MGDLKFTIFLANISEIPGLFILIYFSICPTHLFYWHPYSLFNIEPLFGNGLPAAFFQGVVLAIYFYFVPQVLRKSHWPRFLRGG
jgi:hypothetical protein